MQDAVQQITQKYLYSIKSYNQKPLGVEQL